MAMNFPASPTNGQVYNPSPGIAYQWNGSAWAGLAQASFPDAGSDGKLWARKNAGWTEALHRLDPSVLGDLTVEDDITANEITTTGGITSAGQILSTNGSFRAEGWGGTLNSGVIFLNQAQDRYLFYNGTRYEMPGAELFVGSTVFAGGGRFLTDGNLWGTAWGAGGDYLSTWLNSSFTYRDNLINTKANADGSNAGLFYVQGNAWSANRNLIGYSGTWPGFNVQVDQSYAGLMVVTGNFTSYFAMRRTGNVYMAHQSIPRQQDVPAGAFMTGLSLAGSPPNSMSIAYSYLQWYWNGSWYTVTG
jgi:hypothetical protein